MKIYLYDVEKLIIKYIPSDLNGSILLDYNIDGKENKITIESDNNTLFLKSNGDVNIKENDLVVSSRPLTEFCLYTLEIPELHKMFFLYPVPKNCMVSQDFSVKSLSNITIGRNPNSNIVYDNPLIADINTTIKLENNEWTIEAIEDSLLFVNGDRKQKHQLLMGDVIFIQGLIIIWLNGIIKINNPNNTIKLNGIEYTNELQLDSTSYSIEGHPTNDVSLYKAEDYFIHTSKISESITEETVKIDSPPANQNMEETPLILNLATSLTPAASILIMGLNLYNSISEGRPLMNLITSIVTGVSLVIGSLLIPNVIKIYNKKQKNKKEKNRLQKYRKYLQEKENEIKSIIVKQSQILYSSFKSTEELISLIENGAQRAVWNKEIDDDDFLKVRLGLGTSPAKIKISAPEKHFSLDEDILLEEMYSLVNKYKNLENIPIVTSLLEEPIYAIISQSENVQNYINNLLLQLVTYHSGNDLKIVILTDKEQKWQFMKYLPHNWSEDRTYRFFATNSEEAKTILENIEEIYKLRKGGIEGKNDERADGDTLEVEIEKEKSYKKFLPYYIIISDNNKYISNNSTIEKIIKENKKMGFTILSIGKTIRDVNNMCDSFITFDANEGCIISKNNKEQIKYSVEKIPELNMNKITHKLANIPLSVKKASGELPESLSFLEMYKISKVEQFNCVERWQKNNPTLSLQTLIGVHKDGEEFKLDLHEKYHGPHGLIAGSTGSGKSEFIITYILSLALNYHPNEVQFVLIDYKGGGLAGAFENKETGMKLPHLVGTITNLDVGEMNRTLVSIESELKRRQIIFNKVRDRLGESTIDIYKYQKLYREGAIDEPLAHLFIISDEFAELKSQQPEFMQQLVSTARIGRSLGIHLILATQKPSGVVNDQIWSNSKFKICLKVQDKSDSMEMLKKPDAASIKEKGRFYLQVGYDDYYDIGQSGWSGAQYVPSDKIIKKIDDSIDYIDSVGNVVRSVNDYVATEEKTNYGDQLNNIIKYLVSTANSENIVTKQLWLDNIPEYIYINDLYSKYNYQTKPYIINPIIGEYDNPTEQEQGVLTLNLTSTGNTIIYGQQGSGKENLLTTIVWSTAITHSPEEINFYIIDCGAETLKIFKNVPHVGEVILSENADKIADLLKYLYEEFEKRKDLFSDYGGDYELYCNNSGNKLPLITIIINSFEVFSENFSKMVDSFQVLIRDGSKYGITFILTTSQANGVRNKIVQLCPNKISLQMPNATDYRNVINSKKGLVPSRFFGRGIIANEDGGYEFQSAYVDKKDNIFNYIRENTPKLTETYKTTAYKLPEMPKLITYDVIKPYLKSLDKIPVGYELINKKVTYFNFTKNQVNVILGEEQIICMNFIYALVKIFTKFKNSEVQVLDFSNLYEYENEKVVMRRDDFNNSVNEMLDTLKANIKSRKYNFIFIIGISKYNSMLDAATKKRLTMILKNLNKVSNTTFILSDSYLEYKNLSTEEWYKNNIDVKTGIWIGPGAGNQISIKIQDFDINARKINFPQMGFVINDGKYKIVKLLVEGYDEEDEE